MKFQCRSRVPMAEAARLGPSEKRQMNRPLPSLGPHCASALDLSCCNSSSQSATRIPVKNPRRPSQGMETLSAAENKAIAACALKLREIGDKVDRKQKILNAPRKLFQPGT